TYAYRRHVDEAMEELMEAADERTLEELANLVVLGLNHEQQHQELILTDIKHVFWMNPLRPAFCQENRTSHESAPPAEALKAVPTPLWHDHDEGICEIGHEGQGFCFDNEGPRHKVWLNAFSIATQLVTNREYLEFMEDGGYQRAEFWLSLGWTVVNERGWNAPFYWEERDGTWWQMTLAGMRPVQMSEPVCHVSYFEADAYARWAGARLPSEAEWEVSAETAPIEGSFAESGHFHPVSTSASPSHISPVPRRGLTRAGLIATFFLRMPGGSSWEFVWRGTFHENQRSADRSIGRSGIDGGELSPRSAGRIVATKENAAMQVPL